MSLRSAFVIFVREMLKTPSKNISLRLTCIRRKLAKHSTLTGLICLSVFKRTCHFVTHSNRRRVLYLALVRSQSEHCSQVWRPCSSTLMNQFEVFQKKRLKLILSEQELSYSNEVYIRKCKQVNILTLFCRFNLNDMNLFHKIVYKTIPKKKARLPYTL